MIWYLLFAVAPIILILLYLFSYRISTAFRALCSVYTLPPATIEKFLESYTIFDKEHMDSSSMEHIANYYAVLNHLCAVGEVEKMYIPPMMNENAGILDNQLLFEKRMGHDIGLKPGMHVLDVGCGRGRIAAHVASMDKDIKVSGINIDVTQVRNAKENASKIGMEQFLNFQVANYNDKFPFPDQTFDALYDVQALTYVKDGKWEPLFLEMWRVLKPGAKLSIMDWVRLPKYDQANPEHHDLMRRVKPLIGAVCTPLPSEMETVLRDVGFDVLYSAIPGVDGYQYTLSEKADKFFVFINYLINALVFFWILPKHFRILFDRLTKDGDALIKGDRMGLFTTTYQIVAQKPFK